MPGSIRKRGNSYQASVAVPRRPGDKSPVRIYASFRSEREASLWISDRHLAVGTGMYVPPSAMTFQEVFDHYMVAGQLDPSTRRVYASYGQRMVDEFGRFPLQKVSLPMLERFIASLVDAPRLDGRPGRLSPTSIDHVIRQIKAFFHWARQRDYVGRNVAAGLPRIKEPERLEMTILTVSEAQAMLEASAATAIEAAVWLALTGGLRRGEVLGLRWSDVDLPSGRITVQRSFSATPGGARMKRPKTIASRRTLRLSTSTLELLARVRSTQEATFGYLPEVVCPDGHGHPWRPAAFSAAFSSFLRQTQRKHMRFHDLRHTHASHLIAAGVHIKTISARLGHKSVAFTMDQYGHLIPGVEDGAVLLLDALFQGPEPAITS